MEKLIKGKVLRSVIGGGQKLTVGDVVELPKPIADDLTQAGYFDPEKETRENKPANRRETRGGKKK